MHNLRIIKTLSTTATLAFFVAGCDTQKFNELEQAGLDQDRYEHVLASEYKSFAKSEINQYDWPDQQHFAEKGLIAANGGSPGPEKPENWSLSDTDQGSFLKARSDLSNWLVTNAKLSTPARAAKAQASYDCWVEQKEENWQVDDIKNCKGRFAHHLPEIWLVRFGFDSVLLNHNSQNTLLQIVRDWQKSPGTYLLVQGHADSTGNNKYNYKLSKSRAMVVGHYLARAGIPKTAIKYQIWGESRPRISNISSDKVAPKSNNRRVEVLKF